MGMEEVCKEELLSYVSGLDYDNFSDFKNETYPGPGAWKDNVNYLDIVKIAAYLVTIVFGLSGNVGVIITVVCNKSMRTTINIYVANLAVADAMICVMCMIPQTIAVLTTDVYILGEFMCKFNPFTQSKKLFSLHIYIF